MGKGVGGRGYKGQKMPVSNSVSKSGQVGAPLFLAVWPQGISITSLNQVSPFRQLLMMSLSQGGSKE